MIVASWVMSTVISIPPLFGLKDPVDDSVHSFQTVNRSLGIRSAPETELSTEDLALSEKDYYYFDRSLNDGGLSGRDPPGVMWSTDMSPVYADEAAGNETIFPDDVETNCIISQNLGYADLPRVEL